MHASLAFLNGAGARKEASTSIDATFFQILNLLCTSHEKSPRAGRARRVRAARRRAQRPAFEHDAVGKDCAMQ